MIDEDIAPDGTAARTALWRALHMQVDPAPHVLEDEVGLRLLEPGEDWRTRPDMDQAFTSPFRASIVARARFVEDLVEDQFRRGVGQYVILGAGLDSFVQRRPDIASRLRVFEIDRAGPQAWKQARLAELGLGVPDGLRFVPVDFEAGEDWTRRLAGFRADAPAIVAATGVSMYLTRAAILDILRKMAAFAPGSTLAMTFLLPFELVAADARAGVEASAQGARSSGTPFISFFSPAEMLALAREAGLRDVRHVSANDLAERYFAGRPDGLRPPENGEEFLVARS